MSIVRAMQESIQEYRQREDSAASIAVLQAGLDYLAMMTDVELEEEESEGEK